MRPVSQLRLIATFLATAVSAIFSPVALSAAVTSFDDITFWIGTGSNRAALVIDWNDNLGFTGAGTPGQSLAWGFRWSGAAPTGYDMLLAIDAADPRLQLEFRPNDSSNGASLFGIGYDLDGDGGTFTFHQKPDQGTASDPDDHIQFGWELSPPIGDWSYWNQNGHSTLGSWTFATRGVSRRTLSDGSWDGWSFAPAFEEPGDDGPSAPFAAPTPEPGTGMLLLAGVFCLARRRSRSPVS